MCPPLRRITRTIERPRPCRTILVAFREEIHGIGSWVDNRRPGDTYCRRYITAHGVGGLERWVQSSGIEHLPANTVYDTNNVLIGNDNDQLICVSIWRVREWFGKKAFLSVEGIGPGMAIRAKCTGIDIMIR